MYKFEASLGYMRTCLRKEGSKEEREGGRKEGKNEERGQGRREGGDRERENKPKQKQDGLAQRNRLSA